MMAFIALSERECQVGYLRVRLLSKRFRLFKPDHVLLFFMLLSFNDGFQFSNHVFLLGHF